MIVPEFMKCDSNAGGIGKAFKSLGPVARVLEFAGWVVEYQVIIFPGLAGGFAGSDGCGLACLVLLDMQYSDLRQWQDALAGGGFGVVELQAVVGDDDSPMDTDTVSGEIEVYPLCGASLLGQ